MAQIANKAAVLYPGKEGCAPELKVETIPIPEIGDTDVLIQMKVVGVCGSDDHYRVHGRIWDFIVNEPMILGHESSGIITKLGSKVSGLKVGDRVAIEPGVPCSDCVMCKTNSPTGDRGLYNLCPRVRFCATPPVNGTLTNYYKHPAKWVYKLPDNVSLEEGALCEPASVAVHANRKAGVPEKPGCTVLVLGAGSIGCLCMLTAFAYGAKNVVITDVVDEQLEFAKKIGGDNVQTFNVRNKGTPQEIAEKLKSMVEGNFNAVIECSGFQSSIQTGINAAYQNATVVLIGMADATPAVPISQVGVKELTVKGIFRYRDTYPEVIRLLSEGKLNVKGLIPSRDWGYFKLADVNAAFEMGFPKRGTKLSKPKPIKVMLDCS